MFHLAKNFVNWLQSSSESRITIVVLGVDNAGKTTLISSIKGEVPLDLGPTWGFQDETHKMGKYHLTFYDVGGGDSIRGIWSSYFAEVHGAIYVVDASDAERFDETKEALHDAVNDKRFKGKPLLVFANKQDLPGARRPLDIAKDISLDKVLDSEYHIAMCTALVEEGQPFDPNIEKGVQWLVDRIHANYKALDAQVQKDSEEQRLEQERKKKEQAERVRKMKEERERLKALEEGEEKGGVGIEHEPDTKPARPASSTPTPEVTSESTPLKSQQPEPLERQPQARSPSPVMPASDPLPPIGKTTPTPPPPLKVSPTTSATNLSQSAGGKDDGNTRHVEVQPAPLVDGDATTPAKTPQGGGGSASFALPNSIPSPAAGSGETKATREQQL